MVNTARKASSEVKVSLSLSPSFPPNFLQKIQTKFHSNHVQTRLSLFLQKPDNLESRVSRKRDKWLMLALFNAIKGIPLIPPSVQSPNSTPKAIKGHTSWCSSLWQGKAQPGQLLKIPRAPHTASGLNILDTSQPPPA